MNTAWKNLGKLIGLRAALVMAVAFAPHFAFAQELWTGDSYPPAPLNLSPGSSFQGITTTPTYGTSPVYGSYAGTTVSTGTGWGVASGPYWTPGGPDARIGSPYYYHGGPQGVITGNPYEDHYGPGFQRHSLYGHYRFPYYTYRAPWYYPGRAVYNRDTNYHW